MSGVTRYVTRWALTSGIRVVRGSYTEGGEYFRDPRNVGVFVKTSEALESLDEAVECARKMAKKRAAALFKQAAELSDENWRPKVIEIEPEPADDE